MFVQFAAPNRQAELMLVLALWHELMSEWHPDEPDPMGVPMRRRHAQETLASYLHAQDWPNIAPQHAARACGFDIVLRLASGQIDLMHATAAFFTRAENGQWFVPVDMPNASGQSTVRGVRLTAAAVEVWRKAAAPDCERAIGEARKRLESDVESQGHVVPLLPKQVTVSVATTVAFVGTGRDEYLHAFVRSMQDEPFQPVYRKRPFGQPVKGWDARLQTYFWPAPKHGYRATCQAMQGITGRGQLLASALLTNKCWDADEQLYAVDLANTIFAWGGVPQDPATVTPTSVQQVFQAALDNDAASRARMNSGWTKVAAFATAHLDAIAGGRPQTIWDSRVATAITSRLDRLLPDNADPATLFPGIGTVSGQGGTRPRALSKRWRSGYRSWASQVAGSELVRDIRDILNGGGYPAMPLPEGGTGKWTTRGVEMVLFMDGY